MINAAFDEIEMERMFEFVKKHGVGIYNVRCYPTPIGTKVEIEHAYKHIIENVTNYESW